MPHETLQDQAIARICHDLISPIGAIGNGVELLMDSLGPSPELELIGQSAAAARAKISFFRIAFDSSRPDATVQGAQFAQIAAAMFADTRMRASIAPPGADMPRDVARLLFLLMLCAESALPLGGQLALARDGQGWAMLVTGRRIVLEPAYWAHLQHGAALDDTPAARVHFALARRALAQSGLQLGVADDADSLTIRLDG